VYRLVAVIYLTVLCASAQTNRGGIAGSVTDASQAVVPNATVTITNVGTNEGFVQDDWKIKSNLTLNLGLRYNLEMPRTEKYNNQGVFRPDLAQTAQLPAPLKLADGSTVTSTQVVPFAFSGIGGNSRYLTPPQYRDFEPRFGFAWQPKWLAGHNMVLRGGWGMSHTPVSGFTQLPQPDFGATAAFSPGSATAASSTANPSYIMRLGENPPVLTPTSPAGQVFGPAGPPSNQPLYSATAGAPGNTLYNNIVNMVNTYRIGGPSGALPANFFSVPFDPNFWSKNVNSFDITTLNGYKQFSLKSAYGANFGTLYNSSSPRYIQLGLKIYF
jgi:TonB dependent receptor